MKKLIPIVMNTVSSQQVKTVNARDLHLFLKSKQDFSTWVKKRIKQYGFSENVDFVCFHRKMEANNATMTEYHLTIDMAKELSMVERNAKGKEARQYFIECEKTAKQQNPLTALNDPEAMRGYLLVYTEKVIALEEEKKQNAPMVKLAEAITASTKSIQIGDYVKAISKKTGFVIGRNNFFKWLKYEKILTNSNMPYQRYVDNGWFEVKETTYENVNTNGPRVAFQTLITGSGQESLFTRFTESKHFHKFLNKKISAQRPLVFAPEATA